MTVPDEAFDGPVDLPEESIGPIDELLFALSELLGMTLVEMAVLMHLGFGVGAVATMVRNRYYDNE